MASPAVAFFDPSMFGTYQAKFSSGSSKRERWCALDLMAVSNRKIEEIGEAFGVAGIMMFYVTADGREGIDLRLAYKGYVTNAWRPVFGYLQTKSGTSANSVSRTAEWGFFGRTSLKVDNDTRTLLREMVEQETVTIVGLGQDAKPEFAIPIDLTVTKSDVRGEEVLRHHSKETVDGFSRCLEGLGKGSYIK